MLWNTSVGVRASTSRCDSQRTAISAATLAAEKQDPFETAQPVNSPTCGSMPVSPAHSMYVEKTFWPPA